MNVSDIYAGRFFITETDEGFTVSEMLPNGYVSTIGPRNGYSTRETAEHAVRLHISAYKRAGLLRTEEVTS